MADPISYTHPVTGQIWRKVLYERGSFPDNYTPDECFLAAIKRNQNLHKYTLLQCFHGASQVALQMSVVLYFTLAYIVMDGGTENSNSVLRVAAISSTLGYFSLNLFDHRDKPPFQAFAKDVQHVSIFLFFSFSFSPVLYKLTDTISTDTIHTTAGLMLLTHLMFHNYGLERSAVVSSALSLNAAFFASVCLASRLASSYDAFVLLSFSVVSFVLFPILRLRLNGTFVLIAAFLSMAMSVMLTVKYYSWLGGIFASIAYFIVMGVSPCLFVYWQNHKDTIHGPWDEAVPNIKS